VSAGFYTQAPLRQQHQQPPPPQQQQQQQEQKTTKAKELVLRLRLNQKTSQINS
jgi:hypothetical protein